MVDAYGMGLKAFFEGDASAQFKIESDVAETEYWPVSEFFHSWDEMSELERRALTLCSGRTADVGAGSGSHVIWLRQHGLVCDAIDVSPLAVDVMRRRGIEDAICTDFFKFSPREKYDTLLFVMNGAGMGGTLDRLPFFLEHCKSMLADDGQMLMDSSDLIYLFQEDDGSVLIDLNAGYYGELEYTMSFNGHRGDPFKWLFVDFGNLSAAAELCGLKCELVMENDHYQYLAQLTRR